MAHASYDQGHVYIKSEPRLDRRQTLTPGPSPSPGPSNFERETTPELYDIKREATPELHDVRREASPELHDVRREATPELHNIKQEEHDWRQRESTVGSMHPTTCTQN
jgi:hypothetical protein